MPLVSTLVSAMRNVLGTQGRLDGYGGQLNAASARENPNALYALLRTLYHNSGPYDAIARMAYDVGIGVGAAQGLRNPTAAVVGFYRSVLWGGPLEIETPERRIAQRGRRVSVAGAPVTAAQSDRLDAAIRQGWTWSNWDARRQVFAGNLPMLGDQYLKVAGNERRDRAFFQLIEPEHVSVIDTDERGFLTFIRLDVPGQRRTAAGVMERYTYTEVWDKASGRYREWRHREFSAPLDDLDTLGTPDVDEDMQRYGVDFIPFQHIKNMDDGGPRGVAAIMPALDKIVYGDLLATALHQRLANHNKPDRVLVGTGMASDGMPLPPPSMAAGNVTTIELGGEREYALPSGWRFEPYIANLDYANHLAVVESHYRALQKTDLPELAYYEVSEASDLSGRAIFYMLLAARSRAEQARENAEAGLVRANAMLLTVAQSMSLKGFTANEIGTYDGGDFEHAFTTRAIFPESLEDAMDVEVKRANVVTGLTNAGAGLGAAARAAGYEDDVADDLEAVAILPGLEP